MKRFSAFLVGISILSLLFSNCGGDEDDGDVDPQYKQHMRDFVIALSQYAKGLDSDFIIIPQNGQELVTADGNEDGTPEMSYLNAIDGVGREDLFYGYDYDNEPTPSGEIEYMTAFLDICEQNGVEVLTTDYCRTHSFMDDSYSRNNAKGYISFAAPERELNQIPDYPAQPYNVNSNDIESLSQAKNFLYLINPEMYPTIQSFTDAIATTNYDVIIIDAFFDSVELWGTSVIESLKTKANGGTRLVIAYMSIGEAEDYRGYWQNEWYSNPPDWIEEENPDWEGNYIVRYWNPEWQQIIYGNNNSYLKSIIDQGFDGAYLDIIDAFEYFE
ncbi:MAG: endo alpha-1,4 polygalactosaminidase [Bacteroidales bacterium]|nr:endo alpha-1,4 polygalactosaminidase [Bacteroidales bacterium]